MDFAQVDNIIAQKAIHAVSWKVVVMDAVLYQMLFVVQTMFIVARMAPPVHHLELAREDLM
jgi:hypothetical protein